jgi:hypothetical protein
MNKLWVIFELSFLSVETGNWKLETSSDSNSFLSVNLSYLQRCHAIVFEVARG